MASNNLSESNLDRDRIKNPEVVSNPEITTKSHEIQDAPTANYQVPFMGEAPETSAEEYYLPHTSQPGSETAENDHFQLPHTGETPDQRTYEYEMPNTSQS
ncbi:MAG: hypothetical protein HC825_09505 [Oscillatoriales cyanobacterium RM1_1_9]|nr:hypothetical protein [Oscillatoriales cyanobacterium SM2_3_0]NJO45593.1 hypothetical protein [Oscillatoriales cyanobacterium RM2_1_1]NJO71832.1 hypothetical protein [Oscillatoriales cyanobacterium RM1_1_9]